MKRLLSSFALSFLRALTTRRGLGVSLERGAGGFGAGTPTRRNSLPELKRRLLGPGWTILRRRKGGPRPAPAGVWLSMLGGICLALAAPGLARADLAARVEGELRLEAATQAGDEAALSALASNRSAPTVVQARSLYALLSQKSGDPTPEVRSRLRGALSEPAPELRGAALRLIGHFQDRFLENEALVRAAEDTDPWVRVEALRALRPWTRPRHLYFIEKALAAPWPSVQAESLRNLGTMPYRMATPEIEAAVESLARPGRPGEVRLAALSTLRDWGRLTWPRLNDVLLTEADSEALRLFAIQASDELKEAEDRSPSLLDLLTRDPSHRVAWEAFRRLRTSGTEPPELPDRTARYLIFSNQWNAATHQMAAYLRTRGYRADYRSGAWKVTRP